MARIEKTVFISYRRTNVPWALAISQSLTHSGYDVFFDFTGLASGDFEGIILDNIHARAHFLVLLTPSALERCGEPGDWLRREIETALDSKRNIVPLMLEGFDFGTPSIANQLTGKLASLRKYNSMTVSAEYFDAAMDKLRNKFLHVALETVVRPASPAAAHAATEARVAVAGVPAVAEEELTAQQWFERGFDATELEEKLRFYSAAIRLKLDFPEAFYNRGWVRDEKGELDGAISDYSEAIRLRPDYAEAFNNRGITLRHFGDIERALSDYDQAIRFKPDYSEAFNNRGVARRSKGDFRGAIEDYDEAIRLKPNYAEPFLNRGNARKKANGDLAAAIADYTEAIRLQPDYANAYYNRGNARHELGDRDGALSDYDEAIRLQPDDAEAFNNRGVAREEKGDFEGAIADYSDAISRSPGFAMAFYNRGDARRQQADLEGALQDFNEAIRIKPDYPRAINNRDLVLKVLAARSKT
jgi:tetratricopeptide (TPR) repeat protein